MRFNPKARLDTSRMGDAGRGRRGAGGGGAIPIPGGMKPGGGTPSKNSIEAGKQLFAEHACLACHAVDGTT